MTDRQRIRVGLIGLGDVGRLHVHACRTSQAVELVALCDASAERLAACAAPGEVETYRDYREMLAREQLELVGVLTPAASHRAIVTDIARAGIDVLTEKPIATSVADARAMVAVCQAAGVRLFYGSTYRHLPAVAAARKLIADGAIGTPLVLREAFVGGAGAASQQPLSEAHYPAGGIGGSGMGLVDHGVHLIDIFPWLLGEPIRWVFGRGNPAGRPLTTEYAIMGFESGATGHLLYEDGSWATSLPAEGMFGWGAGWSHDGYRPGGGWDPEPASIHVHGTHGALRIFHYAHALFLFDADRCRQIPLPAEPPPAHFRIQLEAFAGDIAAGRPPSTDGEAGVTALAAVEAIYESSRNGSVVRL